LSYSFEPVLPTAAYPIRLDFQGVQWVLEAKGGALRCVAIEEDIVFEGLLALPSAESGRLVFSCLVPAAPLQLELEPDLVLAPGGRMRVWCALPMIQELGFRSTASRGGKSTLVSLETEDLPSAWSEEHGYYHPVSALAELGPRRAKGNGMHRFWSRLVFEEVGGVVRKVKELRLPFADRELWPMRGGLAVGPAVRCRFDEEGKDPTLSFRSLPFANSRGTTVEGGLS